MPLSEIAESIWGTHPHISDDEQDWESQLFRSWKGFPSLRILDGSDAEAMERRGNVSPLHRGITESHRMIKKNILITGHPRVGKSTIIHRVVERLKLLGCTEIGGFYTLEVSREGRRVGFAIHTLDGRVGRLAEIGLKSRFTLGRYGIDIEQFESTALPALEDAIRDGKIVVIDEIGYMELKSRRFRELVLQALDAKLPVLATVMRSRFDFPEAIKAREDVTLITVKVENRDRLVDEIVEMILGREKIKDRRM